jgi:hypothetical protein
VGQIILFGDLGFWFCLKIRKKTISSQRIINMSKQHRNKKSIPKESGAREYWEWEDVWLVNDGANVKRETKNWILQNNKKPTISITFVNILFMLYVFCLLN